MNFELQPLTEEDLPQFKKDISEAFDAGINAYSEVPIKGILPESDINESLEKKGSAAFKTMVNGEMVGGAIVVIDPETQHNSLELLYVKNGVQSKGIGTKIWKTIEAKFPDTKIWETCTPYFDQRNVHFYINRCGFHAVEFFNKAHPEPGMEYLTEDPRIERLMENFFRFEKQMKP